MNFLTDYPEYGFNLSSGKTIIVRVNVTTPAGSALAYSNSSQHNLIVKNKPNVKKGLIFQTNETLSNSYKVRIFFKGLSIMEANYDPVTNYEIQYKISQNGDTQSLVNLSVTDSNFFDFTYNKSTEYIFYLKSTNQFGSSLSEMEQPLILRVPFV